MAHPNLDLLDRFFAAYGSRDRNALRSTLAADATWTFPGHHALSGTKCGVDAIAAFFDAMGAVMGRAQLHVETLATGVGDVSVSQCQHLRTNRQMGPNLDQPVCVLWRFASGVIVSGQHLVADADALDAFFNAALPIGEASQ